MPPGMDVLTSLHGGGRWCRGLCFAVNSGRGGSSGAGQGPRRPNFGGGSKVRLSTCLGGHNEIHYGGEPRVPRSEQYFMSSASRLDGPNEWYVECRVGESGPKA